MCSKISRPYSSQSTRNTAHGRPLSSARRVQRVSFSSCELCWHPVLWTTLLLILFLPCADLGLFSTKIFLKRWSDEPTHILHTRFNAATLRNNTLPSYKNCPSTHSSPNDVSSPAHCEDGFADMHFFALVWVIQTAPRSVRNNAKIIRRRKEGKEKQRNKEAK